MKRGYTKRLLDAALEGDGAACPPAGTVWGWGPVVAEAWNAGRPDPQGYCRLPGPEDRFRPTH